MPVYAARKVIHLLYIVKNRVATVVNILVELVVVLGVLDADYADAVVLVRKNACYFVALAYV